MAPIGEAGAGGSADVAAGLPEESAGAGAAGAGKKGSYVPPALRGAGGAAGAGAGERMGGKYGERDDLATLRVTNVSFERGNSGNWGGVLMVMTNNRCPRWPRRTSFATCLSASVASLACSSPKIAIPAWRRVSRLLVSRTAATLSRLARRWMVSGSDT